MKNFKLILVLISVCSIIACDPDAVINNDVDYTIKTLTINYGIDSATYTFNYNADKKVQQVQKNSTLYANISYGTQTATIVKYLPYTDTFQVSYSSDNYINNIIGYNINQHYYRNSSNQLDSIRKLENNISLYYNNFNNINNNIINYNQLLPYTCGVINFCTYDSRDTIGYNTLPIQTNLPEQFIGIPLSENFSYLELNPIYLLQLSGILSHHACTNLRSEWKTRYSIFVTQTTPSRYHFNYEYFYDDKGRVTIMKVYINNESGNYLNKVYTMSY